MRSFLFFVLAITVSFTSCKKEEIPTPIDPVDPIDPQVETYSSIKSIFESNCLGCHSPSQNAYISDFTNYSSIQVYLDNTDNTMIDRLNSDDEFYRMPPSGNLSQTDKQKLIDWINSGYEE